MLMLRMRPTREKYDFVPWIEVDYSPSNVVLGQFDETWDGSYGHHSDAQPYNQTYYKQRVLRNYDSMSDLASARGAVGPCKHTRIVSNLHPITGLAGYFNGGYRYAYGLLPDIDADMALNLSYSLRASRPDIVRDFCIKSAVAFKQQFPESTSLMNFLLEAGDIKEMIPNLLEAKAFAKKPRPAKPQGKVSSSGNQRPRTEVRPVMSPKRKGKVQKVISSANLGADNFLRYDFGWKPFLSDIEAFTNVADEVNKKLAYLQEQNGKTRHLKRRKVNAFTFTDETMYTAHKQFYWHPYMENWKVKRSYTCSLYASCDLYQNVFGLNEAWAKWAGIFQSLGFTSPAKIWWNALPFSFVLDWVVPVGDWLQLFSINPFPGAWNFSNVVNTVEESTTLAFYWVGDGTRPEKYAGTVTIDVYDRELGLRVSYEDLLSGFGDLSLPNFADAVALITGSVKPKH